MNWLTDCLDCQLSVSRVNGDVRGDSPTPHFDLFTQILSERLIIPMTTVSVPVVSVKDEGDPPEK